MSLHSASVVGFFHDYCSRLICPSTYRLRNLWIHNILSTFSILQQTLKHFYLHVLHVNWTWNVWLSYLGVDFDDAALTACFSSSKDFSPGFDRAVNSLNNLYIVIPHELRSIAFLCDSSKILFASKKILIVQYTCSSHLHLG